MAGAGVRPILSYPPWRSRQTGPSHYEASSTSPRTLSFTPGSGSAIASLSTQARLLPNSVNLTPGRKVKIPTRAQPGTRPLGPPQSPLVISAPKCLIPRAPTRPSPSQSVSSPSWPVPPPRPGPSSFPRHVPAQPQLYSPTKPYPSTSVSLLQPLAPFSLPELSSSRLVRGQIVTAETLSTQWGILPLTQLRSTQDGYSPAVRPSGPAPSREP